MRRARNRAALEVDSILATFGLLFVIQGMMLAIFGGNYTSYSYLTIRCDILGTTLPPTACSLRSSRSSSAAASICC